MSRAHPALVTPVEGSETIRTNRARKRSKLVSHTPQVNMAKTPSKKTAKVAKTAAAGGKKKRSRRVETYS